MHTLIITNANEKVVWAEHSQSLSLLMSKAADWLCHPEEDASVIADGLWDVWAEGQASCSHNGYIAVICDEHVIQHMYVYS
jgi:hypothetical protein